MRSKSFFPLFVDLTDKNILVVGAGTIALRRVSALLSFVEGKQITLVALACKEEFLLLEQEVQLKIEHRAFDEMDLQGKDLVLIATDDATLNERIGKLCKKKGILVNVASDKSLCDFYFPGIICEGDFVVGVCANGNDHKRTKACRAYLEQGMSAFLEQEE